MKFRENETILDIIKRNVKLGENYQQVAEDILEGKYELNTKLEYVHFSNQVNWQYEHPKAKSTYQLYLHTLNFVNALTKTFETTGEVRYIVKARQIIDSWLKQFLNDDGESKHAWYDHTVSNRIANLIYFQIQAPSKYKLKDRLFEKLLKKHLEFLMDASNYPENNHGIMMDKALILGAMYIEEEEMRSGYINHAVSRIEKSFLRDYSYKNVHLENSPEYHRMVTSWLLKISNILDEIDQPLTPIYKEKLNKAKKYNGIIMGYHGMYPTIGDTSAGRSKFKKSNEDFVDMEAGVAVFNDKKTQSTLVFNCGFRSRTHKHFDDLSFTLSLHKEEIFSDAGKYNYSPKDPIREYAVSAIGHSTILVKNQQYALNNSTKLDIENYYTNDKYKYVCGTNGAYQGVKLKRHIIVVRGDVFIIVDSVSSEEQFVFSQNFLLAPEIEVEELGSRNFKLKTASKKKYVLKEHSERGASTIRSGGNEQAMISRKFNEVIDTRRIEINKKVIETEFVTTFAPEDTRLSMDSWNDSEVSFTLEGESYEVRLH